MRGITPRDGSIRLDWPDSSDLSVVRAGSVTEIARR